MKNIKHYAGKNVSQFADDLMVWETAKSMEEAESLLNATLSRLLSWATDLGLVFSADKSTIVVFTRKRGIERPTITIDRTEIKVAMQHIWE